ncbi:MAG: tetratricopeptide repeat protein [Gemmatimonadales bacterium]
MMLWNRSARTVVLCLLAGTPLQAQRAIPPDTLFTVFDGDTIPDMGAVGGVAVDKLGYVYVADFRNQLWRYTPGGSVERYADGFYGSSGNAVGPRGEVYQSSFHGNYITRVNRDGSTELWADRGLDGPVGIAVGEGGELYVVNCRGGFVSVVRPDHEVTRLVDGPLFACPNGITRDDQGDFFVVNFSNTTIVRVTPGGMASVFADVPGAGGNGHIVYARGGFYVTKLRGHQVFRVERDGTVSVVAGTGVQGQSDGPATTALMSQPNGIAVSPSGQELWVNELVSGGGVTGGAARSVLRRIRLVSMTDVLSTTTAGDGSVEAAYLAYRTARPNEETSASAIAVGYQFLQTGRIQDALAVFRLNATDFPDDPTSQYQLGEAYRFTGQPEQAAAQYRTTLRLDPNYPQAAARLKAVGGE